jgi:hypothetical protein
MAITVNSTPEAYPSAHDDLWFVTTSTNIAQANFKFVYDVYINSVLVARVKQFPDPATSKGIFNAAGIVRSYLSSGFKPNATSTLFSYNGADIYVSYQIQYGEEYGGTTYTNLTNATYQAYNFYAPIFRDPSASYFTSRLSNWLTFRDITKVECGYTDPLFVSWANPFGANINMTATVRVINEAGGTVGSASTTTTQSIGNFLLLDISPGAINTHFGSTIIPSSAYGYGIKLNYASTSSSEIIVTLACGAKFIPSILTFQNSLGGYESFGFRLVNKEVRNYERQEYSLDKYQYVSSALAMRQYDSFKRYNPGSVSFYTKQDVLFQLRSGMLNVQNYNWLKDLIGSPEIYLTNGGYHYPVVVTSGNFVSKVQYADKANFMELEVKYANAVNSQYR